MASGVCGILRHVPGPGRRPPRRRRLDERPQGREAVGPDQRITPLEALKSQTIWAAEQYGEQARRGSLEPGKIADMVILSGNPLKVEPMAIKDIKVLETFKEGRSIFKRQ